MATPKQKFGHVKSDVSISLNSMKFAMRRLIEMEDDLAPHIYQEALHMLGEAVANLNVLKKHLGEVEIPG